MEPTKDHIGLETAKLLKDCEVEAGRYFSENGTIITNEEYYNFQDLASSVGLPSGSQVEQHSPIYTWQEILWEHAEEFFGSHEENVDGTTRSYNSMNYACMIVKLLQQKEYEEADLYFRKHCILIKKS